MVNKKKLHTALARNASQIGTQARRAYVDFASDRYLRFFFKTPSSITCTNLRDFIPRAGAYPITIEAASVTHSVTEVCES